MWLWLAFWEVQCSCRQGKQSGWRKASDFFGQPKCLRMSSYVFVVLGNPNCLLSGRHLVLYTAFRCTGRPGGFCQEGLWGFSRCIGSDGTDGSVGRSVVPVVETCKKLQIFNWSHCSFVKTQPFFVLHFDLEREVRFDFHLGDIRVGQKPGPENLPESLLPTDFYKVLCLKLLPRELRSAICTLIYIYIYIYIHE